MYITRLNHYLNKAYQKEQKSDGEDQEGQGLIILTRNQMLSRLPIVLAQLKEVNNSEKLKNEIRQLIYKYLIIIL